MGHASTTRPASPVVFLFPPKGGEQRNRTLRSCSGTSGTGAEQVEQDAVFPQSILFHPLGTPRQKIAPNPSPELSQLFRTSGTAQDGPRKVHSHCPPARRPSELRPSDSRSVGKCPYQFMLSARYASTPVHSLSTQGEGENVSLLVSKCYERDADG